MTQELTIADVPEARRYEARIGDELVGWVDYGRVKNRLVAVHTEVPSAFGMTVTPRCPLFAAYFERHPEDADLLPGGGT